MAATSKAELLAIIEAQNANVERLMSRLTSIEASLREQTTIPTVASVPASNGTNNQAATVHSAANKTDRTLASEVSGIVEKVAVHGKGLRLEGEDRWYNVISGGKPIFLQVKAGASIRLGLNAAGRVVGAHIQTADSASKGGSRKAAAPSAPSAPQTAAVAADATKIAKNGTVRPPCQFCQGGAHNHYKVEQVRTECAIRQYIAKTGNPAPSVAAAETVANFTTWLRTNAPLKVFAFNTQGFELIGSKPTATSAASASAPAPKVATAAPVLAPKPAASGVTVTRVATTASKAVQDGAASAPPSSEKSEALSKPTEFVAGKVYKGLLAAHAKNTSGLVKFICAEVPGPKGSGTWLQASEKLTPAIVKLNVNDRIAIEVGYIKSKTEPVQMVLGIVRAKLLGSAASETGVTPGVQTSGKQAPAAPRHQATDPKVKAERQKRAAAKRDISESAKSANNQDGTLVA